MGSNSGVLPADPADPAASMIPDGGRLSRPVPGRRSVPVLLVTLLLTGLVLVLGYANKARCVGPQFDSYGQSEPDLAIRVSRDVCYTDIQYLWLGRDVYQHQFPYLHGSYDPVTKQLSGGTLEYPVLTGLAIYLTALPATTDAQFLAYNAVLLSLCGLIIAFLLCRLAGIRAWWWALAPPLVLYAFHNWDLLAVCAVVGAFALVYAGAGRSWGRLAIAAALLGVGGALKFYPLMFVVPLAIWVGMGRRRETGRSGTVGTDDAVDAGSGRQRRRSLSGGPSGLGDRILAAVALVAITGGTFVLANLPFMIAGFDGWWASFEFQWSRPIDMTTNSIWFWGARPDGNPENEALQHTLNLLSTATTAAGLLLAVLLGWYRSRKLPEYPWLQVCAAMLCAYLLLNKVHSPQYTLWLLPFFVLLRIRSGWILAYFAADAAIGIGFFKWQYLLVTGQPSDVMDSLAMQAVMIGVWGRAALLIGLFVAFLWATPAAEPRPGIGSGRRTGRRRVASPPGAAAGPADGSLDPPDGLAWAPTGPGPSGSGPGRPRPATPAPVVLPIGDPDDDDPRLDELAVIRDP